MPSAPHDLSRFLSDLGDRRDRLLDLVQAEDHERASLVEELNELSEQLILADEELRVQQEELEEARAQLATLAAERELLVGAFPHALVVTDKNGTVQRTTPAADQLARRQAGRSRPHPIAVWFDVADRPAVRSMISRRHEGLPRPQRARLRRTDGTTRPVLVTLAVAEDPEGGGELLQWQLVDLLNETSSAAVGEVPPLDVADALADLTVRLEQAPDADAVVAEVVAAVVRLVPEAEQAEVVLGGAAGRTTSSQPLQVAGGSVLVVPMPPLARIRGELVLYARSAVSFSPSASPMAGLLAAHAAVALARRVDEDNLRRAVESGREVGRAVGILVERHRITADAAFRRLVQSSQERHVKLREVARLVTDTGLDPEDLPPR